MWNVRGLGKSARRRQIREYILRERIDIVGLQETVKQEFSSQLLQEICGGLTFFWQWLPAKGRSGGILLGVKVDSLEMEDCSMGDFHIQMSVRDRLSNFRWVVVSVYGPAQHNKSRDFIDELSNLCLSCPLPMVLGEISILSELLMKKILIWVTSPLWICFMPSLVTFS